MVNPSKITERGVTFSLGEFDGEKMNYHFDKVLAYLNFKGKLLFGKGFRVKQENLGILYRLSVYIVKDTETCERLGMDLDKGILLTGPVGCGKTTIMKLVRHIVPHIRGYEVIPARNMTFGFNNLGYRIIEDYGNGGQYCFDDIGIEPIGRYFGKDCNVLGELMLSRHELFLKNKLKTHGTTNLNAEELEERYGQRVRSRMREMFNLIAFDSNANDQRK